MEGEKIISQINVDHYMIDEQSINLVSPGDLITQQQGYMNGHGTYRSEDNIYASLLGTVQITNKLIIVNPLKSRYSPQVGDVIVGKVVEIANKRWKIDLNAHTYGYLNLSSTYIAEARKKNQQDQFNMRKIMQEGDFIVAQIQSANMDKTFNLHTRNTKYGKLQPGVFLQVPYKLIKKQKHHIIAIDYKQTTIGIVLGNNGNIWMSGLNRTTKQSQLEQRDRNMDMKNGQKIDKQSMKTISLIYNILRILSWEGLQISEILLKDLLKFAENKNISHQQLIQGRQNQLKDYLLQNIRQRIPKRLQELSQNVTRS